MEVQIVVESLDPDSNGLIPLSKEKADIILNWENVETHFNEEKPIEGIIFKRVKGGFRVDIGVTAFLPSSQTDLKPITNPSDLYPISIITSSFVSRTTVPFTREPGLKLAIFSSSNLLTSLVIYSTSLKLFFFKYSITSFINSSGVDVPETIPIELNL